jgi:DNA polymerase III alpha subunit (gram-positive type)
MDKIIELAKELVNELKEVKQKRRLDAQEKRTEDRLKYHLKAKGAALGMDRSKDSKGSELAKKFSQKAKELITPLENIEGVNKLKASKIANAKAKEDPKSVEEELEQAELEAEAILDEEELETIVLANSEEKPKRGRKKK